VSGGTKAVSQTQKQQMFVILVGMGIAFFILINLLPNEVTFGKAMAIAGHMGKMEVIDFSFDPSNRYTLWSGLFAGVFFSASYFGTDQSQVQRYLGGKSVAESRMGLLFNALLKVPMQFFILLVGVLVYVFFLFVQPPIFFNGEELAKIQSSEYSNEFEVLQQKHDKLFMEKKEKLNDLVVALDNQQQQGIVSARNELRSLENESKQVHQEVTELMTKNDASAETKDADYIFISFITKYLPHGIVGLLIAVIFSAAMSSTSSELNALASTTTVDFYRRTIKVGASERHYLIASKLITVFWGCLAILFALFSTLLDNLIQAVNILGSLFYGPILGIFLVAFAFKYVRSNAVFIAVFIAEACVVFIYLLTEQGVLKLAYLWLNPIGCLLVVLIAFILQFSEDKLLKTR
jgi:Na+/proline symporter